MMKNFNDQIQVYLNNVKHKPQQKKKKKIFCVMSSMENTQLFNVLSHFFFLHK